MVEETQLERVTRIIESISVFRRIKGQLKATELIHFDAVFGSPDPLTLIIVESKSQFTAGEVRRFSLQVESFVWSLYSLNKRHMVSAIFLSDTPISQNIGIEIARNLSGLCKLYVLDANMSDEEIKSRLRPIGKPSFTRIHLSKTPTRKAIEILIENAPASRKTHLQAILEISEKASNAEEVRKRLLDEYRRLIDEAQDALTKAGS